MSAALSRLLACPACRGPLTPAAQELRCRACALAYPLDDGIPLLVPGDADGSAPDAHKTRQAAHFDREDAEYEIERPLGTPAFHGWLLQEKFRRSVRGLPPLAGRSVLTICGGSGMDAEFLARAGARVVASDISPGAARRTRERARRRGLALDVIVADAERLPFADGALDLVYVHDGLHHLERPLVALAEMARVARAAVSVTEPAHAAVTALAVRLGIALEREEAGNPVVRLAPIDVEDVLRAHGFDVVRAERYAMYYGHRPGRTARLLSRRRLLPAARAGLRAANAVVGPLGNKLAVQARRANR